MDEPPARDQKEDKRPELSYEETPIIDPVSGQVNERPVSESTPVDTLEHSPSVENAPLNEASSVVPEASKIFSSHVDEKNTTPKSEEDAVYIAPKKPNHIGTILFIIILFGLGVWLSMQLRSFFTPAASPVVSVPTSAPLPSTSSAPQASVSASADTAWVTYQVLSGVTRQAISGVSYKLPSGVSAPVCDGGSCPSQGTNLPNGTRFTVAARGKGQLLPDFRGAILTDATGKEFTMKQTTIGGVYGYEYIGAFTGRTGGGYTFTQMRGFLVPVNDNLSIEFNHFANVGVTSDFAKDDAIFDKIIGSFTTNFPTPTIFLVTPTGALFAPTPTSTMSGKGL